MLIFPIEHRKKMYKNTMKCTFLVVVPGDDLQVGGLVLELLDCGLEVTLTGVALHHELVLGFTSRGAGLDVFQVHVHHLEEGKMKRISHMFSLSHFQTIFKGIIHIQITNFRCRGMNDRASIKENVHEGCS